MRLKSLVSGLARRQSGIALLMGVSSMLTGVSWLLKPRPRYVQTPDAAPVARGESGARRSNYFSIRQTRSEIGFVYWVLQGFGYFESFSLHDTWAEAISEANRRLAEHESRMPVHMTDDRVLQPG